jgi:RecA-family ATPase
MTERPELRIAAEYGFEAEPPRNDYPPEQEPYDYPPEPEEHKPPPSEQTDIDRRYLQLTAQLLDRNGLRSIPKPMPLIENWLFKNSLAWIQGKWGNGKTFVAVDIACCVATGTEWHGNAATQGVVLYLIAEGASGLDPRVEAWEAAAGCEATGIVFLPSPVQLGKTVHIDVAAFRMLLRNLQPVLVIIDTQARVTVGAEENSNRDMGIFVDVLETLRAECGSTMLVVHHEPRNGENLRGAVALVSRE